MRGDLIAYSCRERGNDWFAVCVVGVDGTGRRQLTEGLPTSDPGWSPDGRTIVFTRHVDRGEYMKVAQDDLFLVSASGGNARQLTRTHFGRSSGDAAWSPESSPSFDCSAIALLDVRTGRQRPLTSCSGVASSADSPAW